VKRKGLIWKIPCITIGVILGIVLLLLIAVTVVLTTPRARMAVLQKGVELAQEHTNLDIDLQRLYLSPFHHSPKILYHAYKGEEDLPVHVEIDSLFIGHRGQDTLLYVHTLRLKGCMKADPSSSTACCWRKPRRTRTPLSRASALTPLWGICK
jgi:hypothetical protein